MKYIALYGEVELSVEGKTLQEAKAKAADILIKAPYLVHLRLSKIYPHITIFLKASPKLTPSLDAQRVAKRYPPKLSNTNDN